MRRSLGWRARGMAVVVVSSDLEEAIGLAHRVVVLARGSPQGTPTASNKVLNLRVTHFLSDESVPDPLAF